MNKSLKEVAHHKSLLFLESGYTGGPVCYWFTKNISHMIHLFIGLHWSGCSLCFSYLQPTRTSQIKDLSCNHSFFSLCCIQHRLHTQKALHLLAIDHLKCRTGCAVKIQSRSLWNRQIFSEDGFLEFNNRTIKWRLIG